MTPFAAKKMARIKQSGIRRMAEKARALERAGREIIHFEIGRTDFDPPEPIKEAAVKAMNEGLVHYTWSMGVLELREAIAEDLESRLGLEADPREEIMITAGSTGAIMNCLMAVLEPGDEVIVPEPMYLFCLDWGEFLGARTVPLRLSPEEGYQISRAALERCVSERTKLIMINTPHNPTGSGLDPASLEAVAEVARERDLLVISDEVYDRITYEPFEHMSMSTLPGMKERTVLVNSFSKSYAMDGWRIGYLVCPADLMWEIDKAQQHSVINASTFAQFGALAGLRGGEALIRPMLDEYAARRELILDIIESAPSLSCFRPQGAFYVWIHTGLQKTDGWELADRLLEEAGVAVVPGEVFSTSGRGFLRVSYSNTRENIRKGMERLIETVSQLD